MIDDKVENDPEYAAQSEKLLAEYNAAKEELEAMAVQLDSINEVLDKMQEMIPAATLPLNTAIISGLNDRAIIDAISLYTALY